MTHIPMHALKIMPDTEIGKRMQYDPEIPSFGVLNRGFSTIQHSRNAPEDLRNEYDNPAYRKALKLEDTPIPPEVLDELSTKPDVSEGDSYAAIAKFLKGMNPLYSDTKILKQMQDSQSDEALAKHPGLYKVLTSAAYRFNPLDIPVDDSSYTVPGKGYIVTGDDAYDTHTDGLLEAQFTDITPVEKLSLYPYIERDKGALTLDFNRLLKDHFDYNKKPTEAGFEDAELSEHSSAYGEDPTNAGYDLRGNEIGNAGAAGSSKLLSKADEYLGAKAVADILKGGSL